MLAETRTNGTAGHESGAAGVALRVGTRHPHWITNRWLVLGYGLASYVLFLGTVVCFAGFLGNFLVPTTLDGMPKMPMGMAGLINLGLIVLFGLQHSVMARPAFKRWWTQYVPQVLERSTYCVASCAALLVLFVCWQPMGVTFWRIEHPVAQVALWGVFAAGWLVVVGSSWLINHLDLFGVRQVWLHFQGKGYTPLPFKAPLLYRYVRHPLYVGWLMVFWATPAMTLAHVVFAAGMTAYILIAIRYEERDLLREHGEQYAQYRRSVGMLVPKLGGGRAYERGPAMPAVVRVHSKA